MTLTQWFTDLGVWAESHIDTNEERVVALLILTGWFGVTSYLAMHAERFVSLLSVPVSIMSAYTCWMALMWCKQTRPDLFPLAMIAFVVIFIGAQMVNDWNYIQSLLASPQDCVYGCPGVI